MVVCTNFKYSIGGKASTSLAAFSTRFGHGISVLWWLYGGRRSGTLFNEPDTFDICCMHAAIIKLRKWRWCPHKPCCVFYSVRVLHFRFMVALLRTPEVHIIQWVWHVRFLLLTRTCSLQLLHKLASERGSNMCPLSLLACSSLRKPHYCHFPFEQCATLRLLQWKHKRAKNKRIKE